MDEPTPDREADQSGSIVNVELPHDASPMAISRLDTDSEDSGNLLRRLSFRHELKYLPFA